MKLQTAVGLFSFYAAALAACATPAPPDPLVVRAPPVTMAVNRSCVPAETPTQPTYTDTDAALKAASDFAERYRLVLIGRAERDNWEAKANPVLDACR